MIGWIAACVLIALLLPLMGMLYLDVLETKNEAKQQLEKVEKLRREVERKNRDTPERVKDAPVFDRREKYE